MWRSSFMVALSVLLLLACATQASAQHATRGTLLCRAGGVPCDVVMGRIALSSRHSLPPRSVSCEGEQGRETLCIQARDGTSVVRYETVSPQERLTIDLTSSEVRITRMDTSTNTVVRFLQPARGPLRLEICAGDQSRKWESPSLWHLWLAEPELCEEYLQPLLTPLRADWQLAEMAGRIRVALLQQAEGALPAKAELDALVEQLAAPTFSARQAAQRQLRAHGVSILGYLNQLPLTSLDAEQRQRLNDIRESFAHNSPDSPQRVAAWLISDRLLWKTLATDSDQTLRRLAAQQIERLEASHAP
jgi:hypothetical protein